MIDAGGYLFDLDYLKKLAPDYKRNPSIVGNLFRLIALNSMTFVVTRNDFVEHDSVSSFKTYLNKLRWRVVINVHHSLVSQGWSQKVSSLPFKYRVKKNAFPLYAISVLWPILDGLRLSLGKRNLIFLLHPLLTWYVSFLIGYQYFLKFLGIKSKLSLYGD